MACYGSCFGCICSTCGNNQEQYPYKPGECELFCYNCTDCMDGNERGWKKECPRYKISEHTRELRAMAEEKKAERLRSKLKVVRSPAS